MMDPTPAQITAMCLKIQATWTPEERRKRAMHIQGDVVTRSMPPVRLGIRMAKLSDMYGALASFASDASAIRDYAHKCE